MAFENILAKFRGGLSRTRESLFGKVQLLVQSKRTIDGKVIDDLEEILISADVGVQTTSSIVENIKRRVRDERYQTSDHLTAILRDEIARALGTDQEEKPVVVEPVPYVVMVVGVNGAGKTTTVGKLAALYRQAGRKVLVGAADTFRAAANEQLEIWARRAGVEVLRQSPGADPAAVAFDTLSSALARGAEVVLIDTAGRLHTRVNLMEELKKVRRVLQKRLAGAPHDVFLVLDATTGQNGIQQARRFHDAVGVTGLVLTKLDGTAKGGIVLAIAGELGIPVRYVGVGEGMDDLQPFDRRAFVQALFEGAA